METVSVANLYLNISNIEKNKLVCMKALILLLNYFDG